MEDLVTNVLAFAKERFDKDGELYPVFWGLSPIQPVILCIPWSSEQEKQRILGAIRIAFRVLQVYEYVTASEVWFRAVDSFESHRALGKSVSEFDDKREALSILHITKQAKKMYGYEIKRGPVALVPLECMTKSSNLSGRMAELLPGDQEVPNINERRFADEFVREFGINVH